MPGLRKVWKNTGLFNRFEGIVSSVASILSRPRSRSTGQAEGRKARIAAHLPVAVEERLGETLSAGLVEPLATAGTLKHLQVPPTHQQKKNNIQLVTSSMRLLRTFEAFGLAHSPGPAQ